ncbi:hypothetical protein GCM10022222_24920 [Amycolatopsis ultiminotia]|uniref:Uncharacterized protein n=1 Tax=Amycolatopsis ultiminotia TaxID=543629 RepID=A0ABP6VV53_9PSEU
MSRTARSPRRDRASDDCGACERPAGSDFWRGEFLYAERAARSCRPAAVRVARSCQQWRVEWPARTELQVGLNCSNGPVAPIAPVARWDRVRGGYVRTSGPVAAIRGG